MNSCCSVLISQLKNLFYLTSEEEDMLLFTCFIKKAEENTVISLSAFNEKHFNGSVNPLVSMVYCQFLYWLSKEVEKGGGGELADKIFYLNKMLNSVDLFYGIDLPNHWCCAHPMGSVMGRGFYGDFFYFHQGCTVGQNRGGDYPYIGEHVTMYANSSILGRAKIGNGCVIGANSLIIDEEIPDNSVVLGNTPHLLIRKKKNVNNYLVR